MPQQPRYLSTDPNAGTPSLAAGYVSSDPNAGAPATAGNPPAIDQFGEAWQAAKDAFMGVAKTGLDLLKAGNMQDPAPFLNDLKNIGSGIIQSHIDERDKALEAGATGHPVEALGHGIASVIPVAGPMGASIVEDVAAGHYGRAATNSAMVAAPFAAEAAIPRLAGLPAAIAARSATRAAAASAATDEAFAADYLKAIPAKAGDAPAVTAARLERAKPYLAAEHATTPITDVEGVVKAYKAGIGNVDAQVKQLIAQHPTETITTDPLSAATATLARGMRSTDLPKGLAALKSLKGFDQPLTLDQADALRYRLNQELSGQMDKTWSDRATLRATSPVFAAKEAAADSLRDGIYTKLDQLGHPGVRDLRLDQGAMIALRDAAASVQGRGLSSISRTGGGAGARMTIDALKFTPIPAHAVNVLGKLLAPDNLTRDALVERAFGSIK